MEPSYKRLSVAFVGPLSDSVFSNLMDTYPSLAGLSQEVKEKVKKLINCVPRELKHINDYFFLQSSPEASLPAFQADQSKYFQDVALKQYYNLSDSPKRQFYRSVEDTFLGIVFRINFE
ncbi:hypothetical protein BGZ65_002414 [Modicella reniformis]|uniref:Uncharacterized protein n=1 Tax=Modicella reniformis TaxID=1440133 RepID=A0A9P6LS68_9FUNG|nr:hypothetical protein BGZ65_002414 [Modicella reniformis]